MWVIVSVVKLSQKRGMGDLVDGEGLIDHGTLLIDG